MIEKWSVIQPQKPPRGIVVVLPGRCGSGSAFAKGYAREDLRAITVGLTPRKRKWYPLPNGVKDQEDAVNGIVKSRQIVDDTLYRIGEKFGFPREKMALAGFSAGAVMAVQIAAFSREPFAGVVVHSGAILEPELMPWCKHPEMSFILTHNKDDDCFSWDERYMPMKKALIKNNYRILKAIERRTGNHCIWEQDIKWSAIALNKLLGGGWFSNIFSGILAR